MCHTLQKSSTFVPFMQLTSSNRREVIEDLLDIRIFSAMNLIIKEKIRKQKDEIRVLDLSRENVKDKLDMQKKFIEELENRGKENIQGKQDKITTLLDEQEEYTSNNSKLESDVVELVKEQEKVTGAGFSVLDVTNPILKDNLGPIHMFSVFNEDRKSVV